MKLYILFFNQIIWKRIYSMLIVEKNELQNLKHLDILKSNIHSNLYINFKTVAIKIEKSKDSWVTFHILNRVPFSFILYLFYFLYFILKVDKDQYICKEETKSPLIHGKNGSWFLIAYKIIGIFLSDLQMPQKSLCVNLSVYIWSKISNLILQIKRLRHI